MIPHTTYGDPKRPAILFIHGFLGEKRDWDEIAKPLADRYFAIAIDLPGHGDFTLHGVESPNLYTLVEEIIDLLDHYKLDHFSLCGYSMGARLALYIATQFAMRVDTLILESATPGIDDPTERARRAADDTALAQRMQSMPFTDFLRAWYTQPLFTGINSDASRFQSLLSRRATGLPVDLTKILPVLGQGRMPSLWCDVPAITLPALLITGERDEKYSAIAESVCAQCPAATHQTIAGAGHNVHFERPNEYTLALLAFWAKHNF